MDKLKVSELKDIIREYKTNNCPTISKLKKADLIDFIKKMNIDDYGGIKSNDKVKAPSAKPTKKVKIEVKPKLLAIDAPPKGFKNIKVNDDIPIKKSKKDGKCPAKGVNQKNISCDEPKKAYKLLHPDRNLGCPNKALQKFNKYQARCKKDDEPINQNPDDIKETDKTKEMKQYEKNYKVFVDKYQKFTNDIKNLGKKDVNAYLKKMDMKKPAISRLYKKEKNYYDTLYSKLSDIQKDQYDKYHSNVLDIAKIYIDKIISP